MFVILSVQSQISPELLSELIHLPKAVYGKDGDLPIMVGEIENHQKWDVLSQISASAESIASYKLYFVRGTIGNYGSVVYERRVESGALQAEYGEGELKRLLSLGLRTTNYPEGLMYWLDVYKDNTTELDVTLFDTFDASGMPISDPDTGKPCVVSKVIGLFALKKAMADFYPGASAGAHFFLIASKVTDNKRRVPMYEGMITPDKETFVVGYDGEFEKDYWSSLMWKRHCAALSPNASLDEATSDVFEAAVDSKPNPSAQVDVASENTDYKAQTENVVNVLSINMLLKELRITHNKPITLEGNISSYEDHRHVLFSLPRCEVSHELLNPKLGSWYKVLAEDRAECFSKYDEVIAYLLSIRHPPLPQ